MFGLYALPSDDLAGTAISVTASGSGLGDADTEYPPESLIAPSNTGHLNLPSRPAKLTTFDGFWELTFAAPITVGAAHFPYTNWDAGLDVTLEPDGGTPISINVPALWENGWWPSPWAEFDQQTSAIWRLVFNAPNSLPVQLGRLLLYANWRQMLNDVLYGGEEIEEQGQLKHVTDGGVETLYEIWGPRRQLVGEFGVKIAQKRELITLHRSTRNQILPWSLVPDATINDAWLVRHMAPTWRAMHETYDHFKMPYAVKELSRGLPFP